ncbi:MAG: hypothetical protein KDA65_13620 [Planctomycetaceae bacterium]|nr:hypothetical protein [Planctomycetaceae bacterium]
MFGHDQHFESWYKGIVDYDESSGTWNLIYDLSPDPKDRFGGSIQLKPTREFARLKNGEAISITGHFNDAMKDNLDKPIYVVQTVNRSTRR